MPPPMPWEKLTDPRLYRENANVNQGIVVPLAMMDAVNDYFHKWAAKLKQRYPGWEPPPTPMDTLLPSVSNWSRSESMKGSEQLVRSMVGQPQGGEGLGSPQLTPNKPANVPSVAGAALNGAKDLQRDAKRGKWL